MTHRVSQWKEALHRHCYMTTTMAAAARGAAAVGTQLDGTVIIITRQCWCLLLLWHSSTEAAAASMAVHSVAHRSRWLLARVSNRCRQETTKHLRSKHGDHLTIYKRRRQFFDTPLPIPAVFLVLSVDNFDQFLTPPNCRRRQWTAPKVNFKGKRFQRKNEAAAHIWENLK